MGKWAALEVFKFSLYVTMPAVLTYIVVAQPELLQNIIKNRSYIVYPPEGPRPPTAEEMEQINRLSKEKR
ncbi:hypothetical protein WJX73_004275 [Symbiochloris irregularis]|uniref:Uncharacterized protein n=1 Tax=Symbiochloris irregularis TaxID=706552 RepID=A0AAW1P000_9CHLO